jgi:lauroyl/myristoyl acyltransferase
MQPAPPSRSPRGAHRIDGPWLRKLANLGSVYAPEWFKRGSPPLIAAASFSLVADRRRGAVRNLQRVLGVGRWSAHWAALRMFSNFAYCTSEAMEHYSPRAKPVRIEGPGADGLRAALAAGRGVVLVTGHIGSWDIAAKALGDAQCRVHVVMSRELDAATQAHVGAVRARVGLHVVHPEASVFAPLGLLGALRRNEIVAIQIDRSAGSNGVRWLPFLGAPAPFPSGPFVLARLAGAPVLPVFAPRLGRRHYRIHVGEPVPVPPEARDPRVLDRVMLDVVAQLEEVVRRHPRQWFQFAPFWPEGIADSPCSAPESASG